MNTQQLESFVQVAENLNFARAAEELNITQSAVSRQIRSLEEELGTKLFHRSTRTVALTPAGISFLNDAREILIKLQLASQKLKSNSAASIEVLSIGCSNESYLPLLTDLLEKCRNRFPEIHPFFRIIPFRAILNLFVRDEVDILFGFKDDIPMQEDFCYKELIQIPVCFAMPKNHPLAQQKSLTEQDVLSEHIVICDSYEMPSEVKDMQAHIRRNLLPDATNYCENLQTMLTLIRAGYGIGLLPEIPSADPTIKYIHIEPKLSLSYGLFYRESSGNPITKKFLSLLHF